MFETNDPRTFPLFSFGYPFPQLFCVVADILTSFRAVRLIHNKSNVSKQQPSNAFSVSSFIIRNELEMKKRERREEDKQMSHSILMCVQMTGDAQHTD